MVLHGPSIRALQQLARWLKVGAMMRDALMESARRANITNSFTWDMCCLGFSKLAKELVAGRSHARVNGKMGEVWDLEKVLEER
jgi:hypothetical protein